MLKTANDPAVRSRNMPDVLFVDEDGNPIEAGNENVVYVDETGNEIPEEIAQQLLDTGKYLDSREFYQVENSINGAAETNDSQAAFDGSHASFQASVLGSYSKGSGFLRTDSTSTANHQSSEVAQSHAIALAEAQARIFAEAQAQMKRREEEIAQIEADANRESSRLKELIENSNIQQQYQYQLDYQQQMQQLQQQQQQNQQHQHQQFNKSLSNTDVEKSQSLRRIPMPPPKKISDVSESSSNSYNNLKHNREQSSASLYLRTEQPKQQIFDLAQLIGSQEIYEAPPPQRQQTISSHSKQLQHHSKNKYTSSDDDEDYDEVEQQPQIIDEVPYEEAEYENQYSDYEESRKAYASRQIQEQMAYNEKIQRKRQQQQQQQIEQEHLQQQIKIQNEQEQLQRRQQEIIDQVLKADQSRPTSGFYLSDRGESVAASVADYADTNRFQSAQSAITNDSSIDETLALNSESKEKSNSNTFKIGSLKLVGHLRGSSIIRDSSKVYELDLKELEKFYENADETIVSDQSALGDSDEKKENNQFVDPYSLDLFKDQVIELDYGAIDAYTSALNAHLIAERNNEPVPTDLRFASHILTANHAMFLENQIFLGDAYFSSGISREVSCITNKENKEVSALSNENNDNLSQSQSRSTIRNGDQAYAAHTKTTEKASYATNFDENDPYSRSNSFGSAIDLQSQPGYCVSTADLNNTTKHSTMYQQHINDNRSQTEISNLNTNFTHTYDFNSHVLSNTINNMNNTNNPMYRSPTSYLSNNERGNRNNLKSSSNINNVSNSNINYSMDSTSYNGGFSSKSKHMTKSDIYNINNLIAQYSH